MKREGNDNGCAEGWRGWAVLDGEPLQERDWLKERKKERAIVTVEPSDLVWYQQELSGARGEITGALITQTQTHVDAWVVNTFQMLCLLFEVLFMPVLLQSTCSR